MFIWGLGKAGTLPKIEAFTVKKSERIRSCQPDAWLSFSPSSLSLRTLAYLCARPKRASRKGTRRYAKGLEELENDHEGAASHGIKGQAFAQLAGAGRFLAIEMVKNLMNNLHIDLFEGPERLLNFARSVNFDEHLSRARSGVRIREKFQ